MDNPLYLDVKDKYSHEYFMDGALKLASTALANGEFPVGCVVVYKNNIVATGARTGTSIINTSNIDFSDTVFSGTASSIIKNEIDHAEIIALRQFVQTGFSGDTDKLRIYCTLEPCLMCFAAIMLSGIKHVVYGYEDIMGGGAGCDREKMAPLYRDCKISITSGIRRRDSLLLFKSYFSNPKNNYWEGSLLSKYTLKQIV